MMDFSDWDQMLRQYVDQQGRVDYATWKAESAERLTHWLTQTSIADLPSDPTSDEHLAFWLNLYNALVIAQILRQYPIASIRPKTLGVPNWLAFFRFFLRSVYERQGRQYSLNTIEHGILRPTFNEPRIHFALVCAAIGCPLLRNEAYQPDIVREQLEADALQFIQNPAKVRYDAETGILYCSQIFKWYRQDFLKVVPSIPAYIQPYLAAVPLSETTPVHYLDYDWSLNQRISA